MVGLGEAGEAWAGRGGSRSTISVKSNKEPTLACAHVPNCLDVNS